MSQKKILLPITLHRYTYPELFRVQEKSTRIQSTSTLFKKYSSTEYTKVLLVGTGVLL